MRIKPFILSLRERDIAAFLCRGNHTMPRFAIDRALNGFGARALGHRGTVLGAKGEVEHARFQGMSSR